MVVDTSGLWRAFWLRGLRRDDVSVIGFQVRTAVLTPSTYVVSVSGEIDMHSSPALEEELNWVLGNGADNAIVDLVEVGFVDSTALKVLVEALPRFADRGGQLILVSDDRRVQRTLEITGLAGKFAVETSLADAIARIMVPESEARRDAEG
ncbi:MAG: STAS domain-containing protein [Actinobacteria bacterium]|nr:MAG: STAS domain-containing protein [Actinomycetota bacterium]